MPVTLTELESFHQFAQQKLRNGGAESVEELLHIWREAQEREEVHEALREATEDLRAGRFRPADDVTRDLRLKYNLPRE